MASSPTLPSSCGSDIMPILPAYFLSKPPWENATAIEGDLVQFVQNLKQSSGGDIGVHGSISVTQSLLAAGVIDQLRLCVAPAIAGPGKRLFDRLPPIRLELLHCTVSPKG